MQITCILLLALGAYFMLYSIIKYYKSLVELKAQTNAGKLFSDWIYAACFVMMVFFLIGYIANLAMYALDKEVSTQDLLIALIFFFGAVFVLAMIIMMQRMFITVTDKAELKKQLQQQELMSAISQSFTTVEKPQKLIFEALKMSGKFMNVNHAFLARHLEDESALECLSEWNDKKSRPFIGGIGKLPFMKDMQIYNDLTDNGYTAVNDCLLLTHPGFGIIKNYNLRAFLNISIYISGKFWGVLGFIIYESPYNWNESDINLGKLIAGVFSGAISRNMAEKELILAKEMAEQGSRAKSDFLSRMSHEMRTPMNAIIGMTNIGKNSQDPERKNYCFNKIETASAHLLGVINDVLDMSKLEANKIELYYSNFAIEKMLEKVSGIVNQQMKEKNQHFTVSVESDVPSHIISDEQRLSQVTTNLLSNAVKFTPNDGSISLTIRKLTEENGICKLQFEVNDTGIGISEEQQSKLFKPFEQADGSISRHFGGTGLGLAISKQIVEMMGGKIKIKSAAGQGASFIFDIRAETAVRIQTDEKTANEGDACSGDKYDFKCKRILVAEDIDINREIVAALLEFTGITIDFANDGRKAYEIFAANPAAYNLILMDIHMPEIDGYKATEMIRSLDAAEAKTVPIIAMTADVFREDIEKCLTAGMNDHIGKPLDMDDMLAKIGKYVG